MKRISHHRFFLTASIVFFVSVFISLASADDGQGWLNNSVTFRMDSQFSLILTQELRSHEVTYMDVYLTNWQGGLSYRLPHSFYVAFLYKRENSKKRDFNLGENRLTLEGGWKKSLSSSLDVDCRFRTEIRRYDKELAKDHLRFRFRVRLRTRLKIGTLKITPFIATEPFADTLQDTIMRNRFYLGTGIVVGEHVEFKIMYIRQDTNGSYTVHIFNSGVDLKF
jgi:hypothetical protein